MTRGNPAEYHAPRSNFAQLAEARDSAGRPRRAGFELEFTGLSVQQASGLIDQYWNGGVEQTKSYAASVGSPFGDFKVEIDTSILKEERHQRLIERLGLRPTKEQRAMVDSLVSGALSLIVPLEIVTPPLPVDQLDQVDVLCEALARANALGTKASPLFAFGMHINLSIRSLSIEDLLADIRAFAILLPWLTIHRGIDFSRRITKYADEFPVPYLQLILDEAYEPDQEIFIDDYLSFNSTRNRALDLLPVLALLDGDQVLSRADERHLISARAALHIRGPDCRIGQDDWAPSDEWNAWAVATDRLAQDAEALSHLMRTYREGLAKDERTVRKMMASVIERDYRWLVQESYHW